MKAVAFILVLLLLPIPAHAWTPSLMSSGAGQCSGDPGDSNADGCNGAQSSGSDQVANFLASYGTHIPPWYVAGVNYPVGYAGALSDPSGGSLPACASYASNVVTINFAPCTIDHFDFSLHNGIILTVSTGITNGATITITNNNFTIGSSSDIPGGAVVVFSAGITANAIIEFNHFDGTYTYTDGCSGGCPSELLLFSAVGNLTLEYNAFINTNQHDFQYNNVGTLTAKYNYISGIGHAPSHGDFVASNYGGSGMQVANMDYNTGYQDNSATHSNAGGAFCYVSNVNASSAVWTGECNNNTFVAQSGGTNTWSYHVRVDPGSIYLSTLIENNWFDVSGALGGIENGAAANGPFTCIGNKTLGTGAAYTTVYGTGGSFTCS